VIFEKEVKCCRAKNVGFPLFARAIFERKNSAMICSLLIDRGHHHHDNVAIEGDNNQATGEIKRRRIIINIEVKAINYLVDSLLFHAIIQITAKKEQ